MNATPSSAVRTSACGDVLLIEIHHPPINAGSLEVRRGLLQAVEQLARQPQWQAAVLMGGGSTFMAGSDLKEFGLTLQDPQLPAVIEAIEQCPKPVVAAIHGAALGGGFELALGCDARVAEARAVVGLPEVTLGMIPGAGGTQRLPRLVGMATAIELACAGTRVPAAQAQALGLVDHVAEADLREAAVLWARAMAGRKRLLAQQPVPAEPPERIAQAEQAALRAGHHRPPVQAAIAAIKTAATLPVTEALRAERQVFNAFRLGPEARALRHLFFAERQAGKLPAELQAEPRPVKTLAVVGSPDARLVTRALEAGLSVLLIDEEAALAQGRQRVLDHLRQRVSQGRLKAAVAAGHEARLQATPRWDALAQADVVLAAVDADQAVFTQIEAHAQAGAVLATTGPNLHAIASAIARPQDVLGLRIVGPAAAMRLMEVQRGDHTSAQALATGMALGRLFKTVVVPCGPASGSITERMAGALRRQCVQLVEGGTSAEDVNRALEAWGFASGPFNEPTPANQGQPGRDVPPQEIQRLALLALVNEAALLLAEGVALRATDIDVAMVHGLGFPRWEGGPVHWARQQEPAGLQAEMQQLALASGPGARAGELRWLTAPAG